MNVVRISSSYFNFGQSKRQTNRTKITFFGVVIKFMTHPCLILYYNIKCLLITTLCDKINSEQYQCQIFKLLANSNIWLLI